MSSINGSNPLGSVLAGAQSQANRVGSADRQTHDANQARFTLDRAAATEKTLSDVSAGEGAADRDADGRTPWSAGQGNTTPSETTTAAPPGPPTPRAIDPEGLRGRLLDVDL